MNHHHLPHIRRAPRSHLPLLSDPSSTHAPIFLAAPCFLLHFSFNRAFFVLYSKYPPPSSASHHLLRQTEALHHYLPILPIAAIYSQHPFRPPSSLPASSPLFKLFPMSAAACLHLHQPSASVFKLIFHSSSPPITAVPLFLRSQPLLHLPCASEPSHQTPPSSPANSQHLLAMAAVELSSHSKRPAAIFITVDSTVPPLFFSIVFFKPEAPSSSSPQQHPNHPIGHPFLRSSTPITPLRSSVFCSQTSHLPSTAPMGHTDLHRSPLPKPTTSSSQPLLRLLRRSTLPVPSSSHFPVPAALFHHLHRHC